MTENVSSRYRTVEVDGIYYSISKDTPDPLPDEEYDRLFQDAQRQKAAWAKQEAQQAAQLRAMNQPARRDENGGMLNSGLLPGDEPIEMGVSDDGTQSHHAGRDGMHWEQGKLIKETSWDEHPDPDFPVGGSDPVAPEIREMEQRKANAKADELIGRIPGRDPAEIEDVTERQTGWRG